MAGEDPRRDAVRSETEIAGQFPSRARAAGENRQGIIRPEPFSSRRPLALPLFCESRTAVRSLQLWGLRRKYWSGPVGHCHYPVYRRFLD